MNTYLISHYCKFCIARVKLTFREGFQSLLHFLHFLLKIVKLFSIFLSTLLQCFHIPSQLHVFVVHPMVLIIKPDESESRFDK